MQHDPEDLHPTTWAVLRALRAGARLSRNRHFDLFQDPRVRRARTLHRYLRSVARDVLAHPGEISVEPIEATPAVEGRPATAWRLRIDIPTLKGRRTAFLSELELRLLGEESPEVARLLAERAGA